MSIIKLQSKVEKKIGIYYEYDASSVQLGAGGMGRVFKGYRVVERTGERTPVAIKAIYENIPERVVERARREANIQFDNDNLIKMYGFVETITDLNGGTKNKVHYHVIMELLVGVTLEDLLNGVTSDQNGMTIPFAAEIYNQYNQNRDIAVLRIIKPILLGLMALHDKGYIHRDIDPSNIMLTIDGKIKLIDFGICKQIVSLESLDNSLTSAGVFMGKVNYAAPELVLGDIKNQNYTTDIYALGVLIYQLVSGHLPFTGTDQEILSANLQCQMPMKDVKSKEFKKIIRKATEKVQLKRYSSVAELRVDLDRITTLKKDKFDYKKNGKYIWIAVIILILLIGSIIFFKNDKTDTILNKAENLPEQITCVEMYNEALVMLDQKNSIEIQSKGRKQLRILAEDSLYFPAKIKYYTMLLYSRTPQDMQKGFTELEKLANDKNVDNIVIYELGLTYSKGNKTFEEPTIRQKLLDIEVDLIKANDWLMQSINKDKTDYKSVYWLFNNLIELKNAEKLPLNEDKRIVELYKEFEYRVSKYSDSVAKIYKNAVKSDSEILKTWGLIK
ncbi:MAG: serine/threonine protein kinase [Bacteroidales bacterium]|nr:serine/threonine protein kinase [Bacteroidales bacterium]